MPVDDYRKIFNLYHHENQRSADEVLQHTIVAYFIVQCLSATGYFDDLPSSSSSRMKSIIGGLTLRNLQILQFNTHEVFELEHHHQKKGSSKETKFIGGALYPTVALFNHSCDPGVVRYFRGHTIHVHAIKNIGAGQVIAENYGPMYTQQDRECRQSTLNSVYRFDCHCAPCTENWPVYERMSTNYIKLRCKGEKRCDGTVYVPIDCKDFMVKCNECGQPTNIFTGLKAMEDIDNWMATAERLLGNGETDAALRKYITILAKMQDVCVPPFRDYVLCQQKIKDCLLEYGNRYNV